MKCKEVKKKKKTNKKNTFTLYITTSKQTKNTHTTITTNFKTNNRTKENKIKLKLSEHKEDMIKRQHKETLERQR